MKNINLLIIDTSTSVAKIILAKNNKLLGYKHIEGRSHGPILLTLTESLLNEYSIKPVELSIIAVNRGPGSFTGIRIGMTTAKTIAFNLNIPFIAVDTFEVLAIDHKNTVILLDARKNECFISVKTENQITLKPTIIKPEEITNILTPLKNHTILGSGADKYSDLIFKIPDINYIPSIETTEKTLLKTVLKHINNNNISNPFETEPLYIRPPDAVIKRHKLF